MVYQPGRHFLQIPGPTNVPDRVLRAIDHPTIDHRGPEFIDLAKSLPRRHADCFPNPPTRGHLSGIRHRCMGSRTRKHPQPR